MSCYNIYNMVIINVAWYIEQTVSEIKKAVEDCMKNTPPNFEKRRYTYVNGEILTEEAEDYIDEDDWNNGWSKV